jgi:hypothetical protein
MEGVEVPPSEEELLIMWFKYRDGFWRWGNRAKNVGYRTDPGNFMHDTRTCTHPDALWLHSLYDELPRDAYLKRVMKL